MKAACACTMIALLALMGMTTPAQAGEGGDCCGCGHAEKAAQTVQAVEASAEKSACSPCGSDTLMMAGPAEKADMPESKGDDPAKAHKDHHKDHDHAHAKSDDKDHACKACQAMAKSDKEGPCKACAAKAKADAQKPDFALTDQDGKKVKLSAIEEPVVVLEWINPDCPFVKPHYSKDQRTMIKLADKYDDKGVAWLAINSTNTYDVKRNKSFAKAHDVPYPILDDSSGEVGRMFGAKTTPHMVILHKGKVVYNGAIDDNPLGKAKKPDKTVNYVDEALSSLVAGKDVDTARTKPYGCSVKYAPLHNFTLEAHNGKDVSLADYSGQIVVLEWVNPDCPYVKRHYKEGTMETLANKYKDQRVNWLAINSTHYFDTAANKDFAGKHELPYPVLNDSSGKVGHMFGAKTTPHIIIIDKMGHVAYNGAIDDDPRGKKPADKRTNYVDQALQQLLAGEDVSQSKTKPYGCSVKYAKEMARQND